MSIRVYKPTSAGRRNASVNMHEEVTKKTPEKGLLRPKPSKGGRNHHGKITVRGRGGGVKRMYRMIDFRRGDRDGIEGTVVGIEYDPNRSSHIALIEYADGIKRYIIAPIGLKDGMKVISSSTEAAEPQVGNFMPLRYIPTGLSVHCVELEPGRGGQICRSAGSSARLTNKEGRYATLVLPSGEIRRVPIDCRAVIGQVGNTDHQNRRLGKAGLNRKLGRRPKVRGVAMSHHAHPLGGGEGRSKSGRPPVSPSGVEAKGGGTRNRKQHSQDLIIRRRKSKRYGQKR
ncbi:MAG: 50S ribosomal protein L2 [Phycisphaeraceae bacterium]|nr:50S ribosomal protein L2 [Phycisphaeraceae bacterium]MCW5762970.1 50S ribosomal protein L2 [Phycisphaeraceae bacterium]